ncbi:MAG: hypothetical protein GY754_10460 [bacterium]|nr:hypothetical protein [bacterium]
MNKRIIIILISFLMVLVPFGARVLPQGIDEMDRKAQEHFDKKEFNMAITLWLNILDINPENEAIQKKIEMIYEIKQQKDISFQKAKLNYKIAKKTLARNHASDKLNSNDSRKLNDDQLARNFKTIKSRAKEAITSFIIAYRIDPNDQELQALKEEMRRLEELVRAEEEKERLSLELKRKYELLKKQALQKMELKQYKEALVDWEAILSFFPRDNEAQEGRRKCKFAIENRLKFEKIRYFMDKGKGLFFAKNYKTAKLEFLQVLRLDAENREAKDYIEQIDEKLESKRMFAQRRQQAEDFYISGIKDLENNLFEQARENFESALALIENYKDANARLDSIEEQRKKWESMERGKKLERINREFQNGMLALSESRYNDAKLAFGITLSLDPKNDLARKYYERARDAHKQVEEERVDRNSPYFNIINSLIITGKSLYGKGKFKESKKKWERILNLFPKNKVATEFMLKCDLKLNPDSFKQFSRRIMKEGKDLLNKKNYRAALRKFELIRSISAVYPGIDGFIARAQAGLQGKARGGTAGTVDKAEMERRYQAAMNIFGQGGAANINRAVGQLQWILKRDPGNIKALISLNKIQAQGRAGQTIVVKRRAQLSPEKRRKVKKFYNSGMGYYLSNNYKKAINQWRRVLAIDPGHLKAKTNIRKTLPLVGR